MRDLATPNMPETARVPSARDAEALGASGRAIGTALGHYLFWLGRAAARTGAPRLHFLSREGAWLAGHYARLRQLHPYGHTWPEPAMLAVSRRSTFLPSLPDISPASLAPLLAQYRQASAAAVLHSLGLDLPPPGTRPDPVARLPLDRPWTEAGVAPRILGDPWIAATLERRRAAQREALLRYLVQEHVTEGGLLAVADIGWRGTIQDNLARLMPARRVVGHYLALQPPLSSPPPNTKRYGFIFSPADPHRLARRLRFVAPLEFVASGAMPSIVGYVLEGGQARPAPDTLAVVPVSLPAFRILQEGVADGIAGAASLAEPSVLLARRKVLKFLEAPPLALVHLFFEAWRDDRYGAGALRRGAPPLRSARLLSALAGTAGRRALGLELAESGWPWGLLVRDMPFAAPLLRRLILGFDARL